MKKRILSFFLAIISTFSLVVPVFATNTQLSNNPDKVISTMDEKATLLLFLLIWIVSGVLIETSNGRKIRNDIIDKLEHKNYSKTTKWIMSRSIVALMIFDFISISIFQEFTWKGIIIILFTMMSILLHVIVEVVSFSFYKLLNSGRGEN